MFTKIYTSVSVRIALVLALLVGIFAVKPVQATESILYVKWNASGANNGTSWADAYTDLQSALVAASSGYEVWVATGTYKPTSGTDRTFSFVLKNDVAVYGGFVGTETSLLERDYQNNVTILSGDLGVTGDNSDNSHHVVIGSNTNNSAVLDGFTITGGNANQFPLDEGGGMLNVVGSPTVSNVIFINNYGVRGGGMYNYGDLYYTGSNPVLTNVTFTGNSAIEGGGMENMNYSSPVLVNVVFSNNTAVRAGGGMLNNSFNNPTLTNVTFSGNTATWGGGMGNWVNNNPTLNHVTFSGNSAEWGGGMGNSASSPVLTDVTFSGNSATTYGGAISNEDNSNPTLTKVTMSGNSAVTYGGGMSSYGSSALTLTDVIFRDNKANHGGGMYNVGTSNASLTRVSFLDNYAIYGGGQTPRGGGMYNSDSSATLTDVVFLRNFAALGGGISNFQSSPVLTNVLFAENTANLEGGGIHNQASSNPVLTNVTFSGNTTIMGGGGGMLNLSSNPLLLNNTFANNAAFTSGGGIANVGSNPTLTNVILWGDAGNTQPEIYNDGSSSPTVAYSIVQGGYSGTGNIDADPLLGPLQDNGGFTQTMALIDGSPAVDAGDNTVCPDTDQRGIVRPQRNACDIGAYEYVGVTTPPTVLSITRSSANPTLASQVDFHVTFSKAVTGVDVSDFSLTTSGPSGAVVNAVSGSGNLYTVSVYRGNGAGTIRLDVVDDDSIVDAASNPLGGVGLGNGDFNQGEFYTIPQTLTLNLNSVAVNDGWILESSENSNLGGSLNAAASTFNVGDNRGNKQYVGVLHFDTAGLPDNSVITSVTLQVRKQGLTGTDPFTTHGSLVLDVQKPYFGTTAGLLVSDFQAGSGQAAVSTFDPIPVNNWYSAMVDSVAYAYIDLTGTTQFRLRFTRDDDNDRRADSIKLYSGEASAWNGSTATNRPRLIIQYYIP